VERAFLHHLYRSEQEDLTTIINVGKVYQLIADVEERQKRTGSFVGSRPFGKGTTSNMASLPAPEDMFLFLEWIIINSIVKGGTKGKILDTFAAGS
jgi:hypothetical protein